MQFLQFMSSLTKILLVSFLHNQILALQQLIHYIVQFKVRWYLCANFYFLKNPIYIFLEPFYSYMECKYAWQEDELKTNIKRRKIRQNAYTLIYPTDKIKDVKFQSSEQISTFLLKNATQIGYCKWQLFEKSVVDKGEYIKIIYTCRQKFCDAILIYHQKKFNFEKEGVTYDPNKKYYLTESSIVNKHRHVLKLTPKIASQQNIRQYLFDLPVQEKFENHIETIKQKFNLTKCQVRYLKDRVFWKFKDQDHMLRKLSQRKVFFRRKIQNGKTNILLLVSQSMKRNYLSYGDNLCFDVTYKLLKKKRGEAKHLGVGFFVGQDENSRIVLFGLSTIQHQTSQSFQILFQFFFEINQNVPESILTDDQRAIGYALERIKKGRNYKFVHLLDWFHKLQALKRTTKRQPYRQQLFTLFMRIVKQPSKEIYLDIAFEIASMLEKESIMKDFLKQQTRYCLSQAPQKFFGFGISSTRAQSFNGLIKRSVPHQTNLGKLIYFVLRVQKRLINRMAVLNFIHKDLIKNICEKQMLILSKNLQHLAFEQVRQYYEQARAYDVVKPGKSPIHKQIPYLKYERQYKFNLFYDIKYGCWRCECRNNFRTGMPCSHIVRVVKDNKGCIGYYINERWFHNKENAYVRKPSRPGTKHKKI